MRYFITLLKSVSLIMSHCLQMEQPFSIHTDFF